MSSWLYYNFLIRAKGGGGGGMEMLDRMGLARLVNPYFKITVLEISGRPVVRDDQKVYRATIIW